MNFYALAVALAVALVSYWIRSRDLRAAVAELEGEPEFTPEKLERVARFMRWADALVSFGFGCVALIIAVTLPGVIHALVS